MLPFNRLKESHRLAIFIFGALLVLVVLFLSIPQKTKIVVPKQKVQYASVEDVKDIKIHADSFVAPIIYKDIPDISQISPQERKLYFIHILLPAILMVKEDINKNRLWVNQILTDSSYAQQLSAGDSLKINKLMAELKAKDLEELEQKLYTHPTSIVLAQAAIETGWGRSRFCKKANNLFGIWSFSRKEPRIAASRTREGKVIYVRKYDNIYESVRDYFVMMARAPAFRKFRYQRTQTDNPYELIWQLKYYSEKRVEYVVMLRNVIANNQLTRYDHYEMEPYASDSTLSFVEY